MDTPTNCQNCAAELSPREEYCAQCGQKVLGPDARKFKHLFWSSLTEATSLDGKVLPSFWHLIAKPGSLTRAYINGRRKQYLTPISIFLMANVLFFLASSLTDFNLTLEDQYYLQGYSKVIQPWIDHTVASGEKTFEDYEADYNAHARDIAKTMVIIHVPIIALFTFLIGFQRRYLYADHVVAALHFFAFIMIYFASTPYIIGFFVQLFPIEDNAIFQAVVTFMKLWVVPIYVPVMLYYAFRYRWWQLILVTLCYLPGAFIAHMIYRLIQFVLIFGLAV